MKIGIEAQRIFRKKKHGMEVVAVELIKHLQLIDEENEYVIFVRDGEDADCIKETSNFRIKLVKSFSFPDWEQVQLPKAVHKEKVDFLHCTSNTAPVYLDIPLIVTIHDLIYLEQLNFGGSPYQNFGNLYRRFVVPLIAKRASKIITVSNFEKENIIATLKIEDSKISTVYNAKADDFKLHQDQRAFDFIEGKYQLPKGYILFFGNTSPRKNTVGVLRAYLEYTTKAVDCLPLVITSLSRQAIRSMARKNDIDISRFENKLFFPGYVDKEDLPKFYALATIYLYPSFREGFGLPIVEAMACGVPVITANVSSMPEVAGDAALLVDPHDTSALSDAIFNLSTNAALRKSLTEKGFERAKLFDWSRTAQEVLKIYRGM